MNSKMRTLDDIENERIALHAQLTGKEKELLILTNEIGDIATKLQRNYIQETRLRQAAGEVS